MEVLYSRRTRKVYVNDVCVGFCGVVLGAPVVPGHVVFTTFLSRFYGVFYSDHRERFFTAVLTRFNALLFFNAFFNT